MGARIYSRDFIDIDGITYMLERKDVKRLAMRYNDRLRGIAVSIPLSMSDSEVRKFIDDNRDWAVRVMDKMDGRNKKEDELTDEVLLSWRDAVVPIIHKSMDRMNLRAAFHFRMMSSRWGSCIPSKRKITLNYRLASFPMECSEYVIIHELAHLVHSGHGPEFWDLVERYCPDWRRLRVRLKGL